MPSVSRTVTREDVQLAILELMMEMEPTQAVGEIGMLDALHQCIIERRIQINDKPNNENDPKGAGYSELMALKEKYGWSTLELADNLLGHVGGILQGADHFAAALNEWKPV